MWERRQEKIADLFDYGRIEGMERGLYMEIRQALQVLLWLCWIMHNWPARHRLCQILCDICTAVRAKIHC